jgi:hypothetical protein
MHTHNSGGGSGGGGGSGSGDRVQAGEKALFVKLRNDKGEVGQVRREGSWPLTIPAPIPIVWQHPPRRHVKFAVQPRNLDGDLRRVAVPVVVVAVRVPEEETVHGRKERRARELREQSKQSLDAARAAAGEQEKGVESVGLIVCGDDWVAKAVLARRPCVAQATVASRRDIPGGWIRVATVTP